MKVFPLLFENKTMISAPTTVFQHSIGSSSQCNTIRQMWKKELRLSLLADDIVGNPKEPFIYLFILSVFGCRSFFKHSVCLFSGCAGSLLLRRLPSSCRAWTSHRGGFCCCAEWAPGSPASVAAVRGLRSCSSQALEQRFNSCGARA